MINLWLKKVRRWSRDEILERLVRNASWLFASDAIAYIFRFITIALSARALGPQNFGVLVIIQTYVGIIDKLLNFQAWQGVIKFGIDRLKSNNREDILSLLKFFFFLDFTTGLIGFLTAWVFSSWLGSLFSWDTTTIQLTALYSLVILFNVSGTSIGILRLFDRFRLLALQRVVSAGFKLICTLIVFIENLGFKEFLFVWMATTIVEYMLYFAFAIYTLQQENLKGIIKAPLHRLREIYAELIRFVLSTNMNGTIIMCVRELDTIIVGKILGEATAGLYKIAKQFAWTLTQVSNPVYEAIYPELVNLWGSGKPNRFLQLILQTGAAIGGLASFAWMIFFFFGDFILAITVGTQYIQAYPVLLWYMAGVVIGIFGVPLSPAILAMGHAHIVLLIHLTSAIFFFTSLPILLNRFDIAGAGIAFVAYYLFWSTLMILVTLKYYLNSHPPCSNDRKYSTEDLTPK